MYKQARFWTEVYDGVKLFYLSGMQLLLQMFGLTKLLYVLLLLLLLISKTHRLASGQRCTMARSCSTSAACSTAST
jgi:hypothetical protein